MVVVGVPFCFLLILCVVLGIQLVAPQPQGESFKARESPFTLPVALSPHLLPPLGSASLRTPRLCFRGSGN